MSGQRRSGNPRPESTIAQIFADDLDAMFGLTPEVAELEQTVESKKYSVDTSTRELQELEARLRKAEQRLARVSRHASPSPSRAIQPLQDSPQSAAAAEANAAAKAGHPLAQRPEYPADRPPTAHQAPPTRSAPAPPIPTARGGFHGGREEYVMVERGAAQAQRG